MNFIVIHYEMYLKKILLSFDFEFDVAMKWR